MDIPYGLSWTFWLVLSCLIKHLVSGQTTDAGDVVNEQTKLNDQNPAQCSAGNGVCTNTTQSGTGLWCYDCEQSYAKVYDPENAVCINNLSQVSLRQCGPRDKYCKVERMDLHRNVMSIERGCVEECYYGCRFNGYGLTQMRCTSCCRTPCCNEDNSAPYTTTSTSTTSAAVALSYFVTNLMFHG